MFCFHLLMLVLLGLACGLAWGLTDLGSDLSSSKDEFEFIVYLTAFDEPKAFPVLVPAIYK